MKVINKEALKQLIEDITIEDIHVTEPIDSLDASTLDKGRTHEHRHIGEVKIIISGRVTYPDEQL